MLNPDPKKLRWLGIDMRSRARRRCAVALHVAVFFAGMFTLTSCVGNEFVLRRYNLGLWLMVLLVIVCSRGVFREGGVLKPFQEPGWPMKGMTGKVVMLRGLDDRAEYRYGAKFDHLPEAEQSELLRTYRVGNYLFPAKASKAPTMLDEREQREKDCANSVTLKSITGWLFCMAGSYAVDHRAITGIDVAASLMSFGFLALNGPKIYILWTEQRPIENGDPHLVPAHGNAALE